MKNAANELGTGRDAMARDKLRRTRVSAQQWIEKAELATQEKDDSLSNLCAQYNHARAEYDTVNTDSMRAERQVFRRADPAEGGGQLRMGGAGLREQTQIREQDIRPIDLSEFHTEEVIQREKLKNAREIENDVTDLKSTYQEFNSLVNQQQTGIDFISTNIAESQGLIERGHIQIQSSSRSQKSFRKVGCIVGVIIVVVVILVIIVAVIATR
ncbi:syntaxin 7 [Strigomonas culicis]|nr:syntaxin 7 [Strigomonas culicis]|eukprot:EPY30384.1 syntaxin 7 [Strigomonas culicis]